MTQMEEFSMTKLWLAAALMATAFGGCSDKSATTTTATPTSAATAEPTATQVAAATTTTGGDATTTAAADGARGDAAPAAGGPKNILGLNLPKIDKSVPTWKYGVPAPDPFPAKFDPKKDYFAKIKTTKGDITVKFFTDLAPKHATSFIYLSEIGYYDDAPFHRVCKDFMMQGGDPSGQGTGRPGYTVPAEFNMRKHVKGILSAARSRDPDSAGSQFFLMFTAYPSLDNQYTVYGQVSEGLDVVDKFHNEVAVPSMGQGCPPRSKESIKTVEVFTKDKK